MRPCDVLLEARGQMLGQHGYLPDPGLLERTSNSFVFYHYTRSEHLEHILTPDGGLFARRRVACPTPPSEFAEGYLVEGFLDPLPTWMTHSRYFGDLGFTLLSAHIGDILLRIEVPQTFADLYIADYAHILECKHMTQRGRPALNLGYICTTGHEVTQAYVHSYTSAAVYGGGHIAPLLQVVRQGSGIAVPASYIRLADQQPLARGT